MKIISKLVLFSHDTANQALAMTAKIRKQVIKCPIRKREVEITYTVSGAWFSRDYHIVACPAMYDGGGCNRDCQSLLARPSSIENFISQRI